MPAITSHGRRGYRQGCRCDQCKSAESKYQRDLKRRKQYGDLASVAEFPASDPVSPVDSVEAAVRAEVEGLSSPRQGLVAAAIALAKVLDDPRATSTKPAAAGKLADMLESLRKSGDQKKSKLTAIRSMTSGNAQTG